ncbi:MAG: FHA domain-containing protein [Deltaproteobacteria bacterium]|nr:FHA domain-containing protein [Deltaproteobacteria bacterium]
MDSNSGRKPQAQAPLKDGDDLEALDRLGPYEGDRKDPLTRHAPIADLPAVDRVSGPSMASTRIMPLPPGVEATLELDDAEGAPVKLAKTVTVIGRVASAADFVLPFNEEVSREHAAIVYFAGEFFIEDLSSGNGTFVNEQRVEKVKLRYGDKIRVGSQVLVFRCRA